MAPGYPWLTSLPGGLVIPLVDFFGSCHDPVRSVRTVGRSNVRQTSRDRSPQRAIRDEGHQLAWASKSIFRSEGSVVESKES